jgi:hypothetical protein
VLEQSASLSGSSKDVSSWLLAQIDGETVFSANLIQLCLYGGWLAGPVVMVHEQFVKTANITARFRVSAAV